MKTKQNKDAEQTTILDWLGHSLGQSLEEVFARVDGLIRKTPTRLYLVLALGLFLILQNRIAFPNFSEQFPVHTDDTYAYMLKAAQIEENCFFQDCPAANDLRAQITMPTEDPDIAGYRNRIYHRIFVVYHPLHSFALAGLYRLGVTPEIAYDFLYTVGKILLSGSVALWLVSIWGERTAATALLLLAPVIFVSHGIHNISMHSFALAFGLLLWSLIYRNSQRTDILFAPLILLMVLAHPLGKILALISVFLYALNAQKPMPRRAIVNTGTGLAIIAAAFVIPVLVKRPELSFDPVSFYPGNWDFVSDFVSNAKISWGYTVEWINSFGNPAVLVGIALIGFISTPVKIRLKLLIMGLILAALYLFGILYVVPWYGSLSFVRVWFLLAIFTTGAFAAGLNSLIASLFNNIRNLLMEFTSKTTNAINIFSPIGWRIFGTATVTVLVIFSLGTYLAFHVRGYQNASNYFSSAGNLKNQEQVAMLAPAQPGGEPTTVLYMDELAMLYYLSFGGLNHGAVYYTALRFTDDLDFWLTEKEDDIAYAVNRNPLFTLPLTREGGVSLREGTSLAIYHTNNQRLSILVAERTQPILLTLSIEDESDTFTVAPGPTEWIDLPRGGTEVILFTHNLPTTGAAATILGIRTSATSTTFWPWDEGISIRYQDMQGQEYALEITSELIVEPLDYDLTVLDDTGFFILAEVER